MGLRIDGTGWSSCYPDASGFESRDLHAVTLVGDDGAAPNSCSARAARIGSPASFSCAASRLTTVHPARAGGLLCLTRSCRAAVARTREVLGHRGHALRVMSLPNLSVLARPNLTARASERSSASALLSADYRSRRIQRWSLALGPIGVAAGTHVASCDQILTLAICRAS